MFHGNLGLALFYLDSWDSAVQEFSFAISAMLENSLILSMRATAYQFLGRTEDAARDRARAHALDSSIVKDVFPYPLPHELIFAIIDFFTIQNTIRV